jgi:hypothetical protein
MVMRYMRTIDSTGFLMMFFHGAFAPSPKFWGTLADAFVFSSAIRARSQARKTM